MIGWLDLAVIVLYFVGMAFVGIWASRRAKSMEGFALAERGLGYPLMMGTLIGAAIGAASTVGKAGMAYKTGIAFLLACIAYGLGLIIFGLMAPKIRQAGVWTIPEVLERRYGKGMRRVSAYILPIAAVALFGGQLVALGLVFEAVGQYVGITYTTGVLLAGIVTVFYTVVGGLFAVVYTDFIQSAIMLVSILFVLPAFVIPVVAHQGPILQVLAPAAGNPLGGLSPIWLLSIFLIDIPFCLVDPGLWQRAGAARDGKVIRNSMFVAAGAHYLWSIIVVVLGVLGAVLYPNVAAEFGTTDSILPVMVARLLPPVIKGLVLVALMAVMMSTASVALLVVGTTVSNDLVRSYRPSISEKGALWAARGSILALGVFGVIFALVMSGIFEIMLLAFAIFVSGVFIPVMAALYWKKATKAGAIVSSIVATLVVVACYAIGAPFGLEPIMVSIVVSFLLMWGVSLATYKPETATRPVFDFGDRPKDSKATTAAD